MTTAVALGGRLRSMRRGSTLPTTVVDEQHLAEALRVIAGSTRSGATFEQALAAAGTRLDGDIAQHCRAAAAELAIGAPFDLVMERFAGRCRTRPAMLFSRVVCVQRRRGGDTGRLCNRLARLLHERGRLRQEAHAATAQARFTSRAVLAMPILLATIWALASPATLAPLVSTGSIVVSAPAIALIAAGVVVVRSIAVRASVVDEVDQQPSHGAAWRMLARLAGNGSRLRQQVRLGVSALAATAVPVVTAQSQFVMLCAATCVGGAVAWPALVQRQRSQHLNGVARSGLPDLLELSLALLAAGCAPNEALTGSIESCPGQLGASLRDALDQIELGRSPYSALSSLEIVRTSPEIEAWAYALTDGARFGSPASDTIESLLRDVRAGSRERFRAAAAIAGPRIQLAIVFLIVPGVLWIMLVGAAQGLVRQLSIAGILG